MKPFAYSPEVIESFPSTVGGVIHATELVNGPTPQGLLSLYEEEQQATKERIGSKPLSELPSISAWRRTFSGFGTKPTQYRNAAEALLRRLTKAGDIPSINLLVDLANMVSIRYALPVAVFDQSAVTGITTVSFATGDERFTDLGSDAVTHPESGEVVFVDDSGLVSARRWCWRQSAQSAAGPSTTDAVITVEGQHDGAVGDVSKAVADLSALLAQFQPGCALDTWIVRPA